MYGIYIVDDEILIVNDLINKTPWLENGFKVIGSNTNAITAINEIIAMKPDVVFSDLRMPACNGIELIRRVQDNGINTEFVILSAYEDFQASREFFLMGGIDYILKPLDQEKAAVTLEKVSRKLAKKYNQTPTIQFVSSHSKGFDDVVQYIMKNFNKRHTLKDLSERFNISAAYICELFAKHYESSLIIFLNDIRMNEARRLILETDTPLKEIAIFCGYQKYHYFCRVFKTHFGKSPSQLRV